MAAQSTAYAVPVNPGLTVTLAGPATAQPGTSITYNASVTATGIDLANVTLTQGIPYSLTFVSATQTSGPGTYGCTIVISGVDYTSTTSVTKDQAATFDLKYTVKNGMMPDKPERSAAVTA